MIRIIFFVIKLVLMAAIIIAGVVAVVSVFSKQPQLSREWEDDSNILPSFTISTSTVTIENLRDWKYVKDEIVSKDYYNDTFDLDQIEKVDLLFNPFGEWEGVAHSFFVFTFKDGKSVSVSIEARREKGEDYEVIKGALNEYELWYAFGSTEDFITRRAIHQTEELYSYPLLISTTSARALFVDVAQQAHKLETEPAFYNTVTSNCTNLLADSANRVKEGSIPWDISRVLTGYADNQLYRLGLIPNDKPFAEMYKEARIDEILREKGFLEYILSK